MKLSSMDLAHQLGNMGIAVSKDVVHETHMGSFPGRYLRSKQVQLSERKNAQKPLYRKGF
ncbi:unannotated protein [freshwater metagenome]|uniref:Unannotated protein n=1 Tax=freshwater metagenome TaxID=449393 RepID=A0A6J5ZH03_9ZZZZ